MLATYGVKLGEQLVADARSGQLSVQERRGFMVIDMPVPYPFIPLLARLEEDSPVSKGIGGVLLPFTTSVSLQTPEGVQGTVLAKSSKTSWLESKPFNIDPRRDWRNEEPTVGGPYPLIVQVSGKQLSDATRNGVKYGNEDNDHRPGHFRRAARGGAGHPRGPRELVLGKLTLLHPALEGWRGAHPERRLPTGRVERGGGRCGWARRRPGARPV